MCIYICIYIYIFILNSRFMHLFKFQKQVVMPRRSSLHHSSYSPQTFVSPFSASSLNSDSPTPLVNGSRISSLLSNSSATHTSDYHLQP